MAASWGSKHHSLKCDHVESCSLDLFTPKVGELFNECGLVTLLTNGGSMTWDKHRDGQAHIKSRLDLRVANTD